ncbi:hypothetical protein PUN28_008274 [Cardiocondyla obscurior]|uniref:Uncharacterized protein n=1 Tax=Cardiocondyla obscurior TaxID=286306 RepID=A0AAW2FXD1_9HYME
MERSDNKTTNEQIESLDDILNDENFIFTSFEKMDFEDVQPGPSRQLPPCNDVAVAQRQSSFRRKEPLASTENSRDRAGETAQTTEAATLARKNEDLRKRLEILEQKLNRRKEIYSNEINKETSPIQILTPRLVLNSCTNLVNISIPAHTRTLEFNDKNLRPLNAASINSNFVEVINFPSTIKNNLPHAEHSHPTEVSIT